MPVLLPRAASPEEFLRIGRSDPGIAEGALRICKRHGLGTPRLFPTGSLPVFAVGQDRVLKLFPPCHADEAKHERAILEQIRGALHGTVPFIDAVGELEGWPYLLMERLPGEPVAEAWPRLRPDERVAIAAQTGRLLASLHRVGQPHDPDASARWSRFIGAQREACVATQRARGADPRWLEQLPEFLARSTLPDDAPPVLLHTEVMREHVFVAPGPAGLCVTGLVDFEPAMVGAAEYEFASVGNYFTQGDGPALRALLLAYGYSAAELGAGLQRRFLAYALLHRYSSLRRFLQRAPVPPTIRTLDGLAERWWALGDEPGLS